MIAKTDFTFCRTCHAIDAEQRERSSGVHYCTECGCAECITFVEAGDELDADIADAADVYRLVAPEPKGDELPSGWEATHDRDVARRW